MFKFKFYFFYNFTLRGGYKLVGTIDVPGAFTGYLHLYVSIFFISTSVAWEIK